MQAESNKSVSCSLGIGAQYSAHFFCARSFRRHFRSFVMRVLKRMFRRLVPFALVLAAYIIAPRLKENLYIPQRFGFLLCVFACFISGYQSETLRRRQCAWRKRAEGAFRSSMIRDAVLFLSGGFFLAIIIPLLIARLVAYFRNPSHPFWQFGARSRPTRGCGSVRRERVRRRSAKNKKCCEKVLWRRQRRKYK